MKSPIAQFNEAFNHQLDATGAGIGHDFAGVLADVAKLRSRGDIAAAILTARNTERARTAALCPACGNPFNVQTRIGCASVWCSNGACKSNVANDGVDNSQDTSETEQQLADRLVKLIEDAE